MKFTDYLKDKILLVWAGIFFAWFYGNIAAEDGTSGK